MGVRLSRAKPRHLLVSLFYKAQKLLPVERRMNLFLDLAWIGNRLAHESASKLGYLDASRNHFLRDAIRPTDRILDIGCKEGRVLSTLGGAERVGVDYDREAIEKGRRLYPDLTLIHGEAREYLATAGDFDVLILSHVLEHLDEPEDFLRSLKDSFRRIYIEVPDFDATILNHWRVARGRELTYTDNDHVSEFDRKELKAMFARLGLTVEDEEYGEGNMKFWLARVPAEVRPN